MKKLLIGVGVVLGSLVGLVFLSLVALGTLMELNYFPDSKVVQGERLWEKDLKYIKSLVRFDEDEEIEYFYSLGILSIEEDGQFITNKRMVSYWLDEESDQLEVQQARYEEVEDIDFQTYDSWLDDTQIDVFPVNTEYSFTMFFSNEEGGDKAVIAAIKGHLKRVRGDAELRPEYDGR